MPMNLEEFIQIEMARLLEFQTAWRNSNKDDPASFPMSMGSELSWIRMHLGYAAREMERQYGLSYKTRTEAA